MMTQTTPLDLAHAKMMADEQSDAARLGFYERLADSELFMLLESEAEGDNITPELFEIEDENFVMVFDREDRLGEFVGRPAPYAALSGRVIAALLSGQDIGLGLNLGVAPSAILIPFEAVDWLAETLQNGPIEAEARIISVAPPKGLPELLLTALDTKLATAAGLATAAFLVEVGYDNKSTGHLLALLDAVPGAEPALARAVSEALTFSGIEAGMLDVSFVKSSDQMAAALARHGLRFDLPEPQMPERLAPAAPGSDPAKPPILK